MSKESVSSNDNNAASAAIVQATVGQRLLWALDRVRGGSGALNCPLLCKIDGALDLRQLRSALAVLVAKHTALRTTVVPGRVIDQAVHCNVEPRVEIFDEIEYADDERMREFIRRELASPINVRRTPIRITLVRLGQDKHILIINVHHILTDLVSMSILMDDLVSLLSGTSKLAPGHRDSWNSVEYSRWHCGKTADGDFARQQRYWYGRLAGMRPIDTPLRKERADSDGSTGILEARIDAATRSRLEEIGRDNNASTFAVLLALLFAMSHEQTGERDLAVASLFSSRSRSELQRTVAFLVNVLMLRVRVGEQPTFADFVRQSAIAVRDALKNCDLPYQALSPPPPKIRLRDNARADDVVFHATPDRIEGVRNAGQLTLRSLVPEVVGRFDLELAVRPSADGYVVRLTFNQSRLGTDKAERLISDYVAMACRVTGDRRLQSDLSPKVEID